MNADGTNPINLTRNTPDAALDHLESLAIATVDLIRAGDPDVRETAYPSAISSGFTFRKWNWPP